MSIESRARKHPSAKIAALLAAVLVLVGCTGDIEAAGTGASAESVPEPSAPQASVEPNSVATPDPLPELDAVGLESLRQVRIFFAHRSVGGNIVEDGFPAVYRRLELEPPRVDVGLPATEGGFGDHWLDQTEDPQSKLRDFDRWMRIEGVGANADIAVMKLGYVDVVADTDVQHLFDSYRSMMDRLESDYPQVAFLHVTVSVTGWQPENNAAIERFNTLMRDHYGSTGRLYDLASVVSTCADGGSETRETEEGDPYHSICDEYTSDGGHLNELGATIAADGLLRLLVAAAAEREDSR
ncbi:hypothetical protein AB0269_00980 [Microbacterium sp. NPDC077644]|uniref:hypothetical protein n=1 Tax=Microbacterium sp. NPDC077644 TaxID=3155055 RepID=UPI00344FA059